MEGINTGLSVKERMKMFMNQKPAEEVKPKSDISTGVSIRDRQASFQAKPQTDKPTPSFVPSSSQIKVSNPEPAKVQINAPLQVNNPSNVPPVQKSNVEINETSKPAYAAEPKTSYIAEPKPSQVAEVKPVYVAEPKPAHIAQPKPSQVAEPKPAHVAEPKPSFTSNSNVSININNPEPPLTQPKPVEVISTGMSIKERMAAFQNASKPKADYKPTSSSTFASNKETITPSVSVKDRITSASVPQNNEKEERPPTIKERTPQAFPPEVDPKPQEKEEIFTGPSIKERISLTFSSNPIVTKPKEENQPFALASNIEEPEKAPISTGLSIKERMASLQQSTKAPTERTSLNYVPAGPSIKERISLVHESSSTHHHAQKAKTEEIFSSDVKSMTSKFQNAENEEMPKQRESITTGRSAGQNEEFKKRMEGIVFMPPPPMGTFAARPVVREPEPVRKNTENMVLVELEKPVRKRAAANFVDDFEF